MSLLSTSESDSVRGSDSLIVVDSVTKSYRSKRSITHALDATSLAITEGEFVSVIGPSGCGKSTLMMMIAGLIAPTEGRIFVAGEEVSSPIDDVGIVFQEDLLCQWKSTLDNVLMQGAFRDISRDQLRVRADEMLEMVGLTEFANSYPDELSGGMRQRAAICRALVHNPSVLLMDEPFGALDAMTRDQMALDMQAMWADTKSTVFFITHSITEAVMLSDRVLVFGPPPGALVDEVQVDLPRPRHLSVREDPRYAALVGRIRTRLEDMGVIRDYTTA